MCNLLKFRLSQNEFMKSFISKKWPEKFEGFLPYPLINFQGRNSSKFWLPFWEKRWPHKFILNLTELYVPDGNKKNLYSSSTSLIRKSPTQTFFVSIQPLTLSVTKIFLESIFRVKYYDLNFGVLNSHSSFILWDWVCVLIIWHDI